MKNIEEIRQALLIASRALDIAADNGVRNVQCHPLGSWDLDAWGENTYEGWCATSELSDKLLEIAQGIHSE